MKNQELRQSLSNLYTMIIDVESANKNLSAMLSYIEKSIGKLHDSVSEDVKLLKEDV